jgi:Lsr2
MPLRKVLVMAREVVLRDDLTGEAGASTITFCVDGHEYEMELSEASLAKLRAALHPFIGQAREVTPARCQKAREQLDSGAVRAWAIAKGLNVSPKGRVPRWILDQYLQDVVNALKGGPEPNGEDGDDADTDSDAIVTELEADETSADIGDDTEAAPRPWE